MSFREPTEPMFHLGARAPHTDRVIDANSVGDDFASSSLVASSGIAVLVMTSIHHVYGGWLYRTPWRYHVLFVSLPAILVLVWARARLEHKRTDALARWALAATTLVVAVLGIGLFEGVYNHVVKDVLYVAGADAMLMRGLFPAPRYEMPNDAFFELSGIAQVVPAIVAALSLFRFVQRMTAVRSNHARRIAPGTSLGERTLATILGELVHIPDPKRIIHLQFRRFAGCPVCNLHLRSFAHRHEAIEAAGVREVVVFHSRDDELRVHAADLPFAVLADPEKRLYAAFGVESGARAVLDPRAWKAIVRAVAATSLAILRGRAKAPATTPEGGRFGLPADFLVGTDGRVLACKYGAHVDDQWSVDEVLALARALESQSR